MRGAGADWAGIADAATVLQFYSICQQAAPGKSASYANHTRCLEQGNVRNNLSLPGCSANNKLTLRSEDWIARQSDIKHESLAGKRFPSVVGWPCCVCISVAGGHDAHPCCDSRCHNVRSKQA